MFTKHVRRRGWSNEGDGGDHDECNDDDEEMSEHDGRSVDI